MQLPTHQTLDLLSQGGNGLTCLFHAALLSALFWDFSRCMTLIASSAMALCLANKPCGSIPSLSMCFWHCWDHFWRPSTVWYFSVNLWTSSGVNSILSISSKLVSSRVGFPLSIAHLHESLLSNFWLKDYQKACPSCVCWIFDRSVRLSEQAAVNDRNGAVSDDHLRATRTHTQGVFFRVSGQAQLLMCAVWMCAKSSAWASMTWSWPLIFSCMRNSKFKS